MAMDVWMMQMVMPSSIQLMNVLKQKQDNLFQKLAAVMPNLWRSIRTGMAFQILTTFAQARLKERRLMPLVVKYNNQKVMMKPHLKRNPSSLEVTR